MTGACGWSTERARDAVGERCHGWRPSVGVLLGLLMFGMAGPFAPSRALSAQQVGSEMMMMKPHILTYVSFDELEYLATGGESLIEYDGEMWIGGDFNRLWLKASGEQSTSESEGDFEFQALYSRATSSYWNTQVGLRLDHRYGVPGTPTRGLLALGLEGLAPYWFEVESFVFVSHEGDVSARLEASYELLLTQRLIVESEFETNAALQTVSEFGIGSGLNDIELGARMRYEFKREFAPYVGYSWTRSLGNTADLSRSAGSDVSHGALVLGLHWWY